MLSTTVLPISSLWEWMSSLSSLALHISNPLLHRLGISTQFIMDMSFLMSRTAIMISNKSRCHCAGFASPSLIAWHSGISWNNHKLTHFLFITSHQLSYSAHSPPLSVSFVMFCLMKNLLWKGLWLLRHHLAEGGGRLCWIEGSISVSRNFLWFFLWLF